MGGVIDSSTPGVRDNDSWVLSRGGVTSSDVVDLSSLAEGDESLFESVFSASVLSCPGGVS